MIFLIDLNFGIASVETVYLRSVDVLLVGLGWVIRSLMCLLNWTTVC